MDRRPLLALATLALAAPACAQFGGAEDRFNLGARIGVYLPTDSAIRDAFGNSIVTYGIGSVGGRRPTPGKITPEVDFISASRNGNRLFIGSLTFGYEYHFSKQLEQTTIPYARVFGGAAYFDYGINTSANTRVSARKVGLNYGAEVGLLFVNRVRLAARYNAFTEQDGFNFNGVVLTATANLFRF